MSSPSADVLQVFLSRILRRAGAGSASLYLPAADLRAGPTLIHAGPLPPVPELRDPETAAQVEARADPVAWVGSAEPGCGLVRLPPAEEWLAMLDEPARNERRRVRRRLPDNAGHPAAWLGLRFASEGQGRDAVRRLGLGTAATPGTPPWWLVLGGALAWHFRHVAAFVHDPVSQLPGREILVRLLSRAMRRASREASRISLLLLQPDDFARTSERVGEAAGDALIRQVARRIQTGVRHDDPVFRYGGAIFAVLFEDVEEGELHQRAERLRGALGEAGYLDGTTELAFSLGLAGYEPRADEDPSAAALMLTRRAGLALRAARAEGGIAVRGPQAPLGDLEPIDPLNGVFTADAAKDYRNMRLLWDTVSLVSASDGQIGDLATRVLTSLATTFRARRCALFDEPGAGACKPQRIVERTDATVRSIDPVEAEPFGLDAAELVREAAERGEPVRSGTPSSAAALGYAVPLILGDRCLGGIYLEGAPSSLRVEPSDLPFLQGLAGHLSVAMDRARLLRQERERRSAEQRRLEGEVRELREVLHRTRLVHRSAVMEGLLATVRRVAPTDATVLINGESGTGKELLARTVHSLSSRRDKPLVVVDCGAIATSLMDSELFGHEKGAFTGADQRSAGRLAEANGGTVVLDEIGELPLEVQSKLLRFVQEKQYTPVGRGKPIHVDARVVAVTNRDLAAEVEARRFREDLFHRLNVVRLVIPPLRERPEDVLLLARHFLTEFSARYGKPVRELTSEAERVLVGRPWAGNVRELQNCMQQAVILSDGERLGAEAFAESELPAVARGPSTADLETPPSVDEVWDDLRSRLGLWIDAARDGAAPFPLGTWVGEDLVLQAHASGGEVVQRAAELVGLPETTLRRRFKKARTRLEAGLAPRPDGWDGVRACLARLLATANPGGRDRSREIRDVVMGEILARLPDDPRLGAALAGVSEPTFRRWSAALLVPA